MTFLLFFYIPKQSESAGIVAFTGITSIYNQAVIKSETVFYQGKLKEIRLAMLNNLLTLTLSSLNLSTLSKNSGTSTVKHLVQTLNNFIILSSLSILLVTASSAGDLKTYTVNSKNVPIVQVFNGIVEAVREATLSSEVSGRVLEVNFDVDDMVKEGDVLIRVYNEQQKSNVSKIEANLKAAKSRHKEARDTLRRIGKLHKKKQIAATQYDTAKANYDSAKANVDAMNASLDSAKESLKLTVMSAPYSGVVTERHVEVGEVTSPGQALLTGFSLEKLRVSVDIPQRLNSIVRANKKALVTLDNKQFKSDSLTLFPYANKYTGTIKARIAIPENLATETYPGMYAKVAFELGHREKLLIPKNAIVYRSEVTAVYVLDDKSRITFRHVRLGNPVNDSIEILAGLSVNEKVAVDPLQAGIVLKNVLKKTVNSTER